jgi:hypothetical protein
MRQDQDIGLCSGDDSISLEEGSRLLYTTGEAAASRPYGHLIGQLAP